jgi:chemotaxis protein MotB
MGFAKFLFALAVLGLLAVGGYAYWLRGKHVASLDMLDRQGVELSRATEQLGDCSKLRDTDRAEAEKRTAEFESNISASRVELDELRAQRVEAEKRLQAFRALTEKFRKMIDSGKLEVTLRHGRMIVKLPASVLFASGSAELSKEGQTAIADVAAVLKHIHDRHFMVAGHTDNIPVGPPSPFKNNLELSTSRAEVVTEQLIAAGMAPSRLAAAGYSEYEPVRENTTEAGRQENRRIEIVLLPNLSELPDFGLDGDAGAPRPAPSASTAPSTPAAPAMAPDASAPAAAPAKPKK